MRKAGVVAAAFLLAFVVSLTLSNVLEAKPYVCRLTVDPFYYCEPSNRCKTPGEQFCWECQGYDLSSNPCVCTRVGCMVPPQ